MQFTCLVVFLLTFSWSAGQDLHVGSTCTLTDGRSGSCIKLSECQQALQELKGQGKSPKTCFFDKFEPIVCCPKAPGAVIARKCKEYSRYVYVQEKSSWLPGAKPNNRSTCAVKDAGAIFVIGGKKAVPREFPHMALLGYGDKDNIEWACGGSLISEHYVLTAAHCISYQGSTVKWVLLGDLDIKATDEEAEPQLVEVGSVELGPGYRPGNRYNDIALINLKKEAKLNEYVRPACLHTSRNIDVTSGIAAGWGRTRNDGQNSDTLMKVMLPFRQIEECGRTYSHLRDQHSTKTGFDNETMLCIGDPSRPKDTCQGDSGGPFQSILTEPFCMYEILGVTSFGPAHCATNNPSVYTRVSKFAPWIESVVWPSG